MMGARHRLHWWDYVVIAALVIVAVVNLLGAFGLVDNMTGWYTHLTLSLTPLLLAATIYFWHADWRRLCSARSQHRTGDDTPRPVVP
jgi:hypothetical protein